MHSLCGGRASRRGELIARHNLAHTPMEEWCPICVEARGKATVHHSCVERLTAAPDPTLQRGYFFLGIAKDIGPCVVTSDRATGDLHGSMVLSKGPTCPYSIRSAAAFIHELGRPRVRLQTDSENVIIAWARVVQKRLVEMGSATHVTPQAPPPHSHASNGAAERGVGITRGLAKTFVLALSKRVDLDTPFASVGVGCATRSLGL